MKKKHIIIGIALIVVSSLITYYITANSYKNKNINKDFIDSIAKDEKLEPGTYDFTTSTKNMPDFRLSIKGIHTKTITKEDLSDVKLYDFKGKIAYSWGSLASDYTGIKFKDFLTAIGINDYKEIVLIGNGNIVVSFAKEEITDESYIVFYRDNEKILNYSLNFIDFNFLYNYSIEGLVEIVAN